VNRILEVVAERAVAGGRMLARHEGRVVLVAGAIPGERVRARVERISKHTIWARVGGSGDVIEASPDRRETATDPACGGSVYAHISYERQLLLKGEIVADACRRIGRVTLDSPPSVIASAATGYRMRSRLHVRHGRVGFFREGTHALCDAAATGQVLPEAAAAASRVVEVLGKSAERCEALIVSENAAATERVIHVEARERERLDDAFDALAAIDLQDVRLTGITAIDSDDLLELAGDALVGDTSATLAPYAAALPDVSWARRPTSFFQGNRYLTGTLLERVLHLAEGERCVDLYAGVGLFSVPLAASGRRVVAVESDSSSFEDLDLNTAPWRESLDTVRTTVEEWLAAATDAGDVCVVDPPRTGMSDAAIAGLVRLTPPRLVYVSCDAPTLARDAAKLVSAGYRLAAIEGFDLFPNTGHVETVAVFTTGDGATAPPHAPTR
jgi:23S rRNA (uracil1939-C5)-methyltransferase